MRLALVPGIDEDLIEINDDKNIELLGYDLIDIILETSQCVGEPKRHYQVLKVVVSSPERCLLFIALFYPHLMVSTCRIELG